MKKVNILLTSVGRRGYLVKWFKEALAGKGKVFASNSSDLADALYDADSYIITPLIYDAQYIPTLLEYCKENNICAILPLFDVDVHVLSQNKDAFGSIGVKVIVPNWDIVEQCNDKWKTCELLLKNDFPCIKSYISLNDAKRAISKGEVDYPLIVKPRWGMGSIGIYNAEDSTELEVFYNKVKKDIENSYLKYESGLDIESSVIIQEYIDGQEYGMDIINDLQGNNVVNIARKKIGMRSGETDCAEIIENHELDLIGRRISAITNHPANMDVDILEKNGSFYILELNARFGGGYPFSHIAGINLPKAIVEWLQDESYQMPTVIQSGLIIQKIIELQILNRNN